MTREEIIERGNWVNNDLWEVILFSQFLSQDIRILVGFSQFNNDRAITEFTINSINDFLLLDEHNIDWIKNGLWDNCVGTFQNASYGMREHVKAGQSEFEANQELFKIFDREDAFINSKPVCVFIDNLNGGQNQTHFGLEYSSVWDIEHNTTFSFKNGKQNIIE